MNVTDLILHENTRQYIQQLIQSPPHAILLSGERGVGTYTVAKSLALSVTGHPSAVRLITPDEKGSISIDAVRELYVQTRSRTKETAVFLIDQADAMGTEAQNAFLKLLEEPNENIVFILTAHNVNALLPTVLSRVQSVELKKVSRNESVELLKRQGITQPALQAQLLFIGQGLPAELLRLSQDESYRASKIEQAQTAKKLLMGSRYEKLVSIGQLSIKSRQEVLGTLHIAMSILKAQLHKNQDKSLLLSLQSLLSAEEKIIRNGHIKTQLLRTIK